MNEYFGLLRQEVIDMIPVDCRSVLDVGCGNGALGAYLKKNRVTEVCGIELDAAAANEASRVLDQVVQGNVETVELPFEVGQFDCVVCADVLEHLVDPWTVVGRLKALLKPGGVIIASIPNVGFHRIIRNLIKGRWQYADAGILDKTHLRFFTLAGIYDLFGQNGMPVEEVGRKIDGGLNVKLLNLLFCNALKESLVIQYMVRARALHELSRAPERTDLSRSS